MRGGRGKQARKRLDIYFSFIGGVLSELRPLLLDTDGTVQQAAAVALGRYKSPERSSGIGNNWSIGGEDHSSHTLIFHFILVLSYYQTRGFE